MPAQPAWFPKLTRILTELEGLSCAYLDRQAVERLFGVAQRRARQLMSDLPGIQIGNAFAVERLALLDRLRRLAQGAPYQTEQARRLRLARQLEEARRIQPGRQVRITIQPASPPPEFLPEGVRLAPGELRIEFASVEELASRLYGLSQTMAADWEKFAALADQNQAGPTHTTQSTYSAESGESE